jgi:4-alpha-glucanotransferase
LFGDLPIFVAHDSSDVWSHRPYFKLDAHGNPTVVAGVPPDYFSATGQRWGNPLYDWDALSKSAYQWWVERLHTQFEYFDIVRIDHFRGFEAYWEILAEHDTAINGHWVSGPGAKFFHALQKVFGDKLPLVAEDLGFITPQVHALRQQFGLPGMKILQFAFDGGADNPYLPHHHEVDSVVYTGTHDNNTTLGWFNGLTDTAKKRVYDYFGNPTDSMPALLMRSALASVASVAIIPMQDVLSLDGAHRMNTPGTTIGNWQWRFRWEQLRHDAAAKLRELNGLYDRL